MTDFYNKNIQYFKRQNYSINDLIKYDIVEYKVEIHNTTYKNIFKVDSADNQILIHSLYNIEDEFKRTFSSSKKDTRVLILYGIGNGSIFRYIREHHSHYTSIILIEPSAKIFKRAFSNFDAETELISFQHMTFIVGENEYKAQNIVSDFFTHFLMTDFDIAKIVSENILFKEYFEDITNHITDWVRGKRITLSSYLGASQLDFAQGLLNLSLNHQELTKLKRYFKGKPVVIISAGPSLEKHLCKLEELKTKAVLISIGTATKILSDMGIQPHFRAHADHRFFDKIYTEDIYKSSKDIPILFSPKVNHEFLGKYSGRRYMILTNSIPYFQYLFVDVMNMNYIKTQRGSSTANHVFNALAMLECKSIILIGQDMCSYDDNLYANKENKKTGYIEKQMGNIKTVDIYGNPVTSKRIYYQIKSDLEMAVNYLKVTNAFNATEGGLGVEGIPNVTLDSLLQTTLKEQVDCTVGYDNYSSDDFINYSSDFSEGLKKTLVEFQEIYDTIKTIKKQIKAYSSKFYKGKNIYVIAKKLIHLRVNSPLNNISLFAKSFKQDFEYIKMMMSAKYDLGSNNVNEAFKAQSAHEIISMDILIEHLSKIETRIKTQVEWLETTHHS